MNNDNNNKVLGFSNLKTANVALLCENERDIYEHIMAISKDRKITKLELQYVLTGQFFKKFRPIYINSYEKIFWDEIVEHINIKN